MAAAVEEAPAGPALPEKARLLREAGPLHRGPVARLRPQTRPGPFLEAIKEARMPEVALYPRGWHIVSRRPDGRTEHYTPELLDHQFHLGLRGGAWEAQALVDQVAGRLGSDVDAYFDGALMARSRGADVSSNPQDYSDRGSEPISAKSQYSFG